MSAELENNTTGTHDSLRIDSDYQAALNRFTNAVESAIVSSHKAAGIDAGPRRFWGSVLFTRVCTISVSILWLCPRSKVNTDGTHWDFGSIASLARNLFECALQLFYLAIEPLSEDEWLARLKVMQLHDCLERFRMFRAFDPNDPQLKMFEEQANELRAILEKNLYFVTLSEKLQKNLLKGERSSIITQDEILQRMGEFDEGTRGYYRFLSSHAHSFPLGFYRMAEHNRGRGEENLVEKGYIGSTLEFCAGVVEKSNECFQKSFVDIVKFVPGSFDWNVLRNRSSG
jgi:hypothetical protein